MDWSIIVVFWSCLDFHSDGTHSQQRWASYVMLNVSKSVPIKKLIYIMDDLMQTFSKFLF